MEVAETSIRSYFNDFLQTRQEPDSDMLDFDEFSSSVQFRYGLPVIYRQVLFCLAGYCFGFHDMSSSEALAFYKRLKADCDRLAQQN